MTVILEDLRQVFARDINSAFEAIDSLSVEEVIELLYEAIGLLPDLPEGYVVDQDLFQRDEGWKLIGAERINAAVQILESTRYGSSPLTTPRMGLAEYQRHAQNPDDPEYVFAFTTLRDMLSVSVVWLNTFASHL